MKSKGRVFFRVSVIGLAAVVFTLTVIKFHREILKITADIMIFSMKTNLVSLDDSYTEDSTEVSETTNPKDELTKEAEETTTEKSTEALKNIEVTEGKTEAADKTEKENLAKTDSDVAALMKKAKESSAKDKKDGAISDYKYTKDGATDIFGKIRVKNTNKTDIDIETFLNKKADLKLSKDEPSVLIYHTHTTETYQLNDRDFYAVGSKSRSDKEDRNMIRVGKAICDQLEKAGYKVIHLTEVYDKPYDGAYTRSRKAVSEYLEKYPSIEITLDIHRDAIQRSDGTKIAPTVEINGSKAAQIMIISGCQEKDNGITNLPDWKYNLTFALQLQQSLEKSFPGITRPVFFCARSYNMGLTHNSLLVEIGSDANTLAEAVYTGKCLGSALAALMKEYEV